MLPTKHCGKDRRTWMEKKKRKAEDADRSTCHRRRIRRIQCNSEAFNKLPLPLASPLPLLKSKRTLQHQSRFCTVQCIRSIVCIGTHFFETWSERCLSKFFFKKIMNVLRIKHGISGSAGRRPIASLDHWFTARLADVSLRFASPLFLPALATASLLPCMHSCVLKISSSFSRSRN